MSKNKTIAFKINGVDAKYLEGISPEKIRMARDNFEHLPIKIVPIDQFNEAVLQTIKSLKENQNG